MNVFKCVASKKGHSKLSNVFQIGIYCFVNFENTPLHMLSDFFINQQKKTGKFHSPQIRKGK